MSFDEFLKYVMQERWVYVVSDDKMRDVIAKYEMQLIVTDFN